MPQISERTVLFADLRGSTSLYEKIGNAAATQVVTAQVAALADGLMAVFRTPVQALGAADQMHMPATGPAEERLRLQVAIAHGEVVELAGDCFGDAVNVAARLLGHAGDSETLITGSALSGLDF